MKKESEVYKAPKKYTCDNCKDSVECMWAYNPSCVDGECIVEVSTYNVKRWRL